MSMNSFINSFVENKSKKIDELAKALQDIEQNYNQNKEMFFSFQKEYEMLSKEKKEDLKKTADALKEIYKTIDQYEAILKKLEDDISEAQ